MEADVWMKWALVSPREEIMMTLFSKFTPSMNHMKIDYEMGHKQLFID